MRLLLALGDPISRTILGRFAGRRGHDVSSADSGREALEPLQSSSAFDCVVCGTRLRDMSGAELCGRIRELPREGLAFYPYLLVVCGQDEIPCGRDAVRAGADGILWEPLGPESLEIGFIAAERVSAVYGKAAQAGGDRGLRDG